VRALKWDRADDAAFGHVNNKQALTHFESSRIVWMTELAKVCRSSVVDLTLQHCTEATQRGFRGKGVGVIQQGISARWRRPITFPDTLLVGSRVHNVKADRFDLGTICWSFECVGRMELGLTSQAACGRVRLPCRCDPDGAARLATRRSCA